MPERALGVRLLGALSAGLLAVLLAGPVALAQTEEVPPPSSTPDDSDDQPEQHPPGSWGASSFEAPFDEPDPTLRRSTFDIAGTLRYEKTGPSDFIEEVEVRVVDDSNDSFTPGEACTLPEPVTFRGEGPGAGLTAEQAFLVEAATLPCNGRYVVEAEGHLEDPDAGTYTLARSFVLAVLPESVTGLAVTLDGEARAVTVSFQPLADDDVAPDALGYVVERSGPDDAAFVDVGTIALDDEALFVDPLDDAPAGAYTYRVRAVRTGPDGELRSSVIDVESDTVEVEGAAPSPTTSVGAAARRSTTSRSSGGRLTIPRGGVAPRLGTPTTLDTGFEDSLDYGDGPVPGEDELAGDEPVAGQSIVQDEADGMGLAVPAAGALVMLGWAGHILYLTRLAKQL